jgi:hypothetical protein
MPTNTYTPIATITLTSSDSEIVFSSIPATYRDLIVVCNFQNSGLASASRLRLNGDTGSNYSSVWMVGNGSVTGSSSESAQTSARLFGASAGPSNTFSNVGIVQIMDYSATDKHKTVLDRFNSANTDVQASAIRWANNTAVTSVTIFDVLGQTYSAGSTFSLYGVIA